ncbi:MAG: hypothetical protein GY862_11000 [Gammaproteobacteria bacterium]|nr:hypothetical protein [Gammaproteobacteria bacterium]
MSLIPADAGIQGQALTADGSMCSLDARIRGHDGPVFLKPSFPRTRESGDKP